MGESPHDGITGGLSVAFAGEVPCDCWSSPAIKWLCLSLLLLHLWVELSHVLHSVPCVALILEIVLTDLKATSDISGIIDESIVCVSLATVVDVTLKSVEDLTWGN